MILNILIGGEAGQGLKTTSGILGKTLFRMGFNIFNSKDYMSRIRGGHNFIKLRISDQEITGPDQGIDLLVALNKETVETHKADLNQDGLIIYEEKLDNDHNCLQIPAKEIASDINPRALNTVYVGAALQALGLEIAVCKEVISEYFDKESVVEDNIELLEKGYQKSKNHFKLDLPDKQKEDEIFLDGNTSIALGALAGGVKFYSAYPMSPSTSIMGYIAGKQKEMGVVVEQAEDEIAAINMTIGASYAGVRAMTGTSGGGLALMTEGIGLAGITETPIVIAEVQRPGPATGLPTRTEQGDLLFIINASQGEFPLIVITPCDHQDAFYQTFRALNLAEKYQTPVIILSDQFLADSATNIKEFALDELEIKRDLVDEKDYKDQEYLRYKLTENGISPRAYPGQIPDAIVLADSDEHNQAGHIIEDAETRNKMVEKRQRKEELFIKEDLKEPDYFGEDEIDYLLVGWGSTRGPVREALQMLNEEGLKCGFLSFSDIWPLPEKKIKEIVKEQDLQIIDIENNSTAQFARLLRGETGIKSDINILKYDGRPFTGQDIYQQIKKEVSK